MFNAFQCFTGLSESFARSSTESLQTTVEQKTLTEEEGVWLWPGSDPHCAALTVTKIQQIWMTGVKASCEAHRRLFFLQHMKGGKSGSIFAEPSFYAWSSSPELPAVAAMNTLQKWPVPIFLLPWGKTLQMITYNRFIISPVAGERFHQITGIPNSFRLQTTVVLWHEHLQVINKWIFPTWCGPSIKSAGSGIYVPLRMNSNQRSDFSSTCIIRSRCQCIHYSDSTSKPCKTNDGIPISLSCS